MTRDERRELRARWTRLMNGGVLEMCIRMPNEPMPLSPAAQAHLDEVTTLINDALLAVPVLLDCLDDIDQEAMEASEREP